MVKKCIALCLALILSLPVSALAAETSRLPEVGEVRHGFAVTGLGRISQAGAQTVTMEHVQSGATLCWVANSDQDRGFSISFRTPALDDKGTPHILEHITLSGSEAYPCPNLFFSASYGTYSTFVNAATYDTFTTYPVSSMDEDQLLALADLYLDGVFHPKLYTDERVFQREAWRYVLTSTEEPLTLTGTVYNEMKGAVDLQRAAGYNALKALFPGSLVGNNSGGDPGAIPDLTWEALVNYQKTYYHPSNALIILYGHINLDRFLERLDSGYLSDYTRREITVDRGGIPAEGFQILRHTFPTEAGTPMEGAAVFGYGMAAIGAGQEERVALSLLADLLSGGASPVSRRLRESLPGAVLSVTASTEFAVPFLLFTAQGVDEGQEEQFRAAVDRGLTEAAEGLDAQLTETAVARARMALRSVTESGQTGPELSALLAQWWAREGTLDFFPVYEQALDAIEGQSHYLETLVQTRLLAAPHSALAVTAPAPGGREAADSAQARRLAEIKEAMTQEERAAMVEKTLMFHAWAAQKPSAEETAQLKAVAVQDLPEDFPVIPVGEERKDGVCYLSAPAETDRLDQTALALDLSSFTAEELHWAGLYAGLLGGLGTSERNAEEVSTLTARYLSGFRTSPALLPQGEERLPVLWVQWRGLEEDRKAALGLVNEVLFHTDCSGAEGVGRLLSQLRLEMKTALDAEPAAMQRRRAQALVNPGRYGILEEMNGLAYYSFLCQQEERMKTDPDYVTGKLKEIQTRLTNRQNAVTLCAGSRLEGYLGDLKAFWNAVPQTPTEPVSRPILSQPGLREAVVLDTAVQYNLTAARLEDVGLTDSGKLPVLGTVLEDRYFNAAMRHVIGAYGAHVRMDEDGLVLSTYRDPSVAAAYAVMEKAAEAAAQLTLTQEELDGYILRAYSNETAPAGALTDAFAAMMDHRKGETEAEKIQKLREMKSVTPEDLKILSGALEKLCAAGIRSTVGGGAAVEGNRALFDTVLYPYTDAPNNEQKLTQPGPLTLLYGKSLP